MDSKFVVGRPKVLALTKYCESARNGKVFVAMVTNELASVGFVPGQNVENSGGTEKFVTNARPFGGHKIRPLSLVSAVETFDGLYGKREARLTLRRLVGDQDRGSDQGRADFSGGPTDDPSVPSMGVVKVIVAPAFTTVMGGYPGFFAPNNFTAGSPNSNICCTCEISKTLELIEV